MRINIIQYSKMTTEKKKSKIVLKHRNTKKKNRKINLKGYGYRRQNGIIR